MNTIDVQKTLAHLKNDHELNAFLGVCKNILEEEGVGVFGVYASGKKVIGYALDKKNDCPFDVYIVFDVKCVSVNDITNISKKLSQKIASKLGQECKATSPKDNMIYYTYYTYKIAYQIGNVDVVWVLSEKRTLSLTLWHARFSMMVKQFLGMG